jgi:penicillin-binding protein 1C
MARRRSRPRRIAAAISAAAGAALLFISVLRFIPYPELAAFRARSWGLVIEDASGAVLRVIPAPDGVKREWAGLDEIPPGAVKIFVHAEDARFYLHPGIDPLAILASAVRNFRAGRTVSGASTITMQLARLVRPRATAAARPLDKAREAWDALRLEARLSKREILELWINSIPFGSNIEGLPAMARFRFGYSAARLDDAASALLAVTPRNPSRYDPAHNPRASAEAAAKLSARLRLGLDAPLLLHRAAEADRAGGDEETAAEPRPFGGERAPFFAPHFTERLARELARRDAPPPRRVRSTLDLFLQNEAETYLAREIDGLADNRVSNGAVFVIENETGAVRVYAGSRSWFDLDSSGRIDGVTTVNQPGSCLKPFLYALALDAGFTPADILPDIPTVFGAGEAWIPANFNNRFNGPVRLRVSLASSLNIPAVYLIERLGVRNFEDFLIRLGFASLAEGAGTYGAGLALGNAEVSLEELVCAFAAFPRGGVPARPVFIAGEREDAGEAVMSPRAAWLIAGILADRDSRFTGFGAAPVFTTGFPAMFKTGTANQYQHIWALGATARYTAGVWMGNFSGETVVGRTGSSIPARIVARLLSLLEAREWPPEAVGGPVPSGLMETEICALSGMAAGPFCPGVLLEWLEGGADTCTWHRGGSPVYPGEYQSWLAERFRGGAPAPGPRDTAGGAYIRLPASGAIFYRDPSQPPASQAIRIETAGFPGEAFVYADGLLQGTLNRAGVFVLPLETGRHEVIIEDGEHAARVWFEVR